MVYPTVERIRISSNLLQDNDLVQSALITQFGQGADHTLPFKHV